MPCAFAGVFLLVLTNMALWSMCSKFNVRLLVAPKKTKRAKIAAQPKPKKNPKEAFWRPWPVSLECPFCHVHEFRRVCDGSQQRCRSSEHTSWLLGFFQSLVPRIWDCELISVWAVHGLRLSTSGTPKHRARFSLNPLTDSGWNVRMFNVFHSLFLTDEMACACSSKGSRSTSTWIQRRHKIK